MDFPSTILLSQDLIDYLNVLIRESEEEILNSDFDETKPVEFVKLHNYQKGVINTCKFLLEIHNTNTLKSQQQQSDSSDLPDDYEV